MWYLLLTLIGSEEYAAHSVYATQAECEYAVVTELDVCATVTLNIIELPKDNPITVTELPPVEAD